jgi:hypothetical protein
LIRLIQAAAAWSDRFSNTPILPPVSIANRSSSLECEGVDYDSTPHQSSQDSQHPAIAYEPEKSRSASHGLSARWSWLPHHAEPRIQQRLFFLRVCSGLHAWHRSNKASQRLETIPGIGPITATALAATITDLSVFRSCSPLMSGD